MKIYGQPNALAGHWGSDDLDAVARDRINNARAGSHDVMRKKAVLHD